MEWINIEHSLPKHQGVYEIKIQTPVGTTKTCRADWSQRRGFSPVSETIRGEEYILEWRVLN